MDPNILKKIPFLKEVDFSDEKTRRKVLLYSFLGVVFVIVFLILPALKQSEDKLSQAGPPSAQQRQRNLLEVADAVDRDNLPDKTIEVLSADKNGNVSIYGEDVDIMDDKTDSTKTAATALAQTQQTKLDSSINSLKASLLGESGGGAKSAPPAAKKKKPAPKADIAKARKQDSVKEDTKRFRRTGGVSTLDDEWSSLNGVSSLRKEERYVEHNDDHLYKVMFTESQKLRSGEKLYLRLLEDLVLEDGILVPRNTHVSATCRISERLEITLAAIEINGRTYKMNYVAYDNDGSEGLYCPETAASDAAKVAGETAQGIADAAIGSRLSNIASQVFSAGARIVQNKAGERSVSIDSGYEFYILKVTK